MFKLFILAVILWILLFTLRVGQIGGLDPTYRDQENELLKPFRQSLSDTATEILPRPASALLSGIVFGDGQKIPFYLKKQLQSTSTIHMVVASGQNLSIVAGFVMSLVYLLGRRKTMLLALLAITLYSLLTGLQVPIIRAGVMVLLTFLAQWWGREKEGSWVLFLTAAMMLLYNPNWLLSISFQLSFLATTGVIVVAPIFLQHLGKIPQVIRQDLAVTLAAQLLTLPVIAYNFQQLSLLGIIANILLLWTIPIVMISGFISIGLGLINTFLGQVVGLLPAVLLTYFINIVEFFAKLPGAGLQLGETSVVLWVGYYLLMVAGLWMLKINSKKVISNM
ncbi:MAG: ComEC/Rec2 family competence protein [Patescibacteria group bacterium]|nr:ComEC/Rec2 family competence protein [Patescibacteria group bacterium]